LTWAAPDVECGGVAINHVDISASMLSAQSTLRAKANWASTRSSEKGWVAQPPPTDRCLRGVCGRSPSQKRAFGTPRSGPLSCGASFARAAVADLGSLNHLRSPSILSPSPDRSPRPNRACCASRGYGLLPLPYMATMMAVATTTAPTAQPPARSTGSCGSREGDSGRAEDFDESRPTWEHLSMASPVRKRRVDRHQSA